MSARALGLAGGAWRAAFDAPVLGVAGSNGKTTTKEMLSAILAQRGECLATKRQPEQSSRRTAHAASSA